MRATEIIENVRVSKWRSVPFGMVGGPIFREQAVAFSRNEAQLEKVADVMREDGWSITIEPLAIGVYQLDGHK